MTKFFTTLLFAALLFTAAPHSTSFAQDETSANEPYKVDIEAVNKKQHAYDLMDAITDRISRKEHDHFMRLYGNYNLIETVSTVRTDVKNAVQACGENNPHIKPKLDERYVEWDSAIDPVMIESKANLNNMILAQDYAKKEELDEIFAALTEVRETASKQITKIPVTTEEACLFLHGKMDETQESMMKILKSTLISLPPTNTDIDEGKTAEPTSSDE